MIEIPRFNAYELRDIILIPGQAGIPMDYHGVTSSVSVYGAATEYIVTVEEDDFEKSVDLLKDHFRIMPILDEPFDGPCPACNSLIRSDSECPECGLSLMLGTPSGVKDHPFYRFLQRHGMLGHRDEDCGRAMSGDVFSHPSLNKAGTTVP